MSFNSLSVTEKKIKTEEEKKRATDQLFYRSSKRWSKDGSGKARFFQAFLNLVLSSKGAKSATASLISFPEPTLILANPSSLERVVSRP
ncbi:hypothetical protein C1H46_007570 [Malus baccata]|uniref:Uncharacterized protein n=1 Tax=Malus baccata TaxID=106549 RepID=A0A540N6W2_MALBA|nr:hypothetical protein C1H46_007570 [Malus baccata]